MPARPRHAGGKVARPKRRDYAAKLRKRFGPFAPLENPQSASLQAIRSEFDRLKWEADCLLALGNAVNGELWKILRRMDILRTVVAKRRPRGKRGRKPGSRVTTALIDELVKLGSLPNAFDFSNEHALARLIYRNRWLAEKGARAAMRYDAREVDKIRKQITKLKRETGWK
jgi:hypothetical protein